MSKEALKLALEVQESMKGVLKSVNALVAENKALKEAHPKQEQSTKCVGEPVAWKLMPKNATDAMLKAMDECSTEGYDERLYAGHASSVYTAAWNALDTTPQQRTWAGLTDDDKVLIKHDANYNQFMTAGEYADRVQQLTEARLKDKNNA